MPLKYKAAPPLTTFYSSTAGNNTPLDPIIGFDRTDLDNPAYKIYGHNYNTFSKEDGFDLRTALSATILPGDTVYFFIDKTTNNLGYATSFQLQATTPAPIRVRIQKSELLNLGEGSIEIYGNITSNSRNTIFVFTSLFFTLQKP